jgi:hypothetical protein
MDDLTGQEKKCGQWAKVGLCEYGKRFVKILYCGKDWCPNCRERTHNRRIARLLPKVETMAGFGFFTFTMPLELRAAFRDKEKLSELRTYLRRKLKRLHSDLKAINRWHWFGDKSLRLFNPHFNSMIDELQCLESGEIEQLKKDYKRALERISGIEVEKTETNPEAKINLYYYYFSPESIKYEFLKKRDRNYKILSKKKRAEMRARLRAGDSLDEIIENTYLAIRYHRLRYLTRPTFLVYQKELAQVLKGYHNGSVWGKFRELDYEEVEYISKKKEAYSKVSQEVVLLESGCCPECGKKIHWSKKLYPSGIADFGEELGGGYFMLDNWPRGSPVKLPSKEQIQKARNESFKPGRMFADI